MDWTVYLVYPLLMLLLCYGVRIEGRGRWNTEWLSLRQTKQLQGFMAVLVMFHHMGQKTCAPWHAQRYIVHGLDLFVPIGYFFVGVFLFFSGFGLYKSIRSKPDYLSGFPRRRILPVIAAFYLSEWLYLAVRLLMGERMDWKQLIWYVTGLQLANPNAWYVIALPFFYLFFYVSFRLFKKDSRALMLTGLLTLGYITAGTFIDHNDWWMRGEWWYNTAHFFVLGLLFARFEQPMTRVMKRYWLPLLVLTVAGTFIFFHLSERTMDVLSYYGENWHAPDKVLRRWGCLSTQILASTSFVAAVLLLGMKIRLGNRMLTWLGSLTLELYLVHGLFVDLFGYDFLEVRPSLVYIRSVPLYVLSVVACSIPSAMLFKYALKFVDRLMPRKKNAADEAEQHIGIQRERIRKSPRQRMEEKARRKATLVRAGKCIILAAITALIMLYVVQQIIIPAISYRHAERLRTDGQFDDAAAAFASLGSYRDAKEQVAETYYRQAKYYADSGDYTRAAAMLITMKGYRDVDMLLANDEQLSVASAPAAAIDAEFAVGNTVTFGSYPQSIDGTDTTPIEWLVIAREREKALLVSCYALECLPYHRVYGNVTWEACSLRTWLNNDFILKAFTDQEQDSMITALIDNGSAQGYFTTDGGAATRDKVFLLSYADAWTYLRNAGARVCRPTAYVLHHDTAARSDNRCRWWLRSPGLSLSSACIVTESGDRQGGYVHEDVIAVRPAVWVDLGSGYF